MSKERVLYYDVLNVLACFGVVAMHFNGIAHAFEPRLGWVQALAVDCLFFWAVPIFLMISGATLMDYRDRYDTKTFLARRCSRVLVPFVCWSLIALAWKVRTGQMEMPDGPLQVINLVINAQVIDIYFFFIPLIMIYLCIPALSMVRDRRRFLWYLVAVGGVVNYAIPFVCGLVGIEWNPSASFPLLGGYLMYPVLGYLLRDHDFSARERGAIYAVGALAVLVRFSHTVVASFAAGTLVTTTWGVGYVSLTGLLESVAVFVFFRQFRWERIFRGERARNALAQVAGCTFGIYLTHMFLFWYGLQWTGLNGGHLAWRVGGTIVTYVLCLALVWVARRIPVVRRLFP